MSPRFHFFKAIGGEHPGVAFIERAAVKFYGFAARAHEHDFSHAGCVRQLTVAEVQPTGFHSVHFDIAVNPIGAHTLYIAKLNVFSCDVPADSFANRTVGRFSGQWVER